ncbi:hypothetical protein BKA62DRAFT_686093 [Auriculariales sp. MPI-PUGE-AT-0066]|nr:hypothetical protein BKA62DRAFT_686093 [Auriculariales sp. MPI-PUGE-AT-0066]
MDLDQDGGIVIQLIRHWLNERHAPDILPFQGELVEHALQLINDQKTLVERLRAYPKTSEEEHFKMGLVQTEMERVKFIVRSYLRTRLFKIEKFTPYILSSQSVQTRLSAMELAHTVKYGEIIATQFNNAVLQHLPADMRALTDEKHTYVPAIITEPDKMNFVFARPREDITVLRPSTSSNDAEINKEFSLAAGITAITSYQLIEDSLVRGMVELI